MPCDVPTVYTIWWRAAATEPWTQIATGPDRLELRRALVAAGCRGGQRIVMPEGVAPKR